MRYVIVDLEATCWENADRERMEIIEIGAVLLSSSTGPEAGEFSSFVKPVASRELSDFCKKLTTISQEDVDGADYYYEVLPRFVDWIGDEPFRLCSWGSYDLNQIRQDCMRHKLLMPPAFENHVNIKREFSRLFCQRPMGMMGAMHVLKLHPEGTHHRGIDDARNIAKIAQLVLPKMES